MYFAKLLRGMKRLRDPRFFYFYAQRALLEVHLRRAVARIEARLKPRSAEIPALATARSLASQLSQRGYTESIDLVSAAEVAALRWYFEQQPLYDPVRPQHGQFDFNTIPADTHIGMVVEEAVARAPGIMRAANDPRILGALELLFGCKPTLEYVLAWWSVPGHESPEEAQSFHRDVDGLNFMKVFLYLTDVDRDSGPHVFVAGSHRQNFSVTRIWRHSDEEIRKFFGLERIITFTGPAGTCFMENTFGFHKGALPKDRIRLLAQFFYTTSPTPYAPIQPFLRPEEMPATFDPYVNRRFVAA